MSKLTAEIKDLIATAGRTQEQNRRLSDLIEQARLAGPEGPMSPYERDNSLSFGDQLHEIGLEMEEDGY